MTALYLCESVNANVSIMLLSMFFYGSHKKCFCPIWKTAAREAESRESGGVIYTERRVNDYVISHVLARDWC